MYGPLGQRGKQIQKVKKNIGKRFCKPLNYKLTVTAVF